MIFTVISLNLHKFDYYYRLLFFFNKIQCYQFTIVNLNYFMMQKFLIYQAYSRLFSYLYVIPNLNLLYLSQLIIFR
jgi:hypothetical protein